jgi:hypothetical protein
MHSLSIRQVDSDRISARWPWQSSESDVADVSSANGCTSIDVPLQRCRINILEIKTPGSQSDTSYKKRSGSRTASLRKDQLRFASSNPSAIEMHPTLPSVHSIEDV